MEKHIINDKILNIIDKYIKVLDYKSKKDFIYDEEMYVFVLSIGILYDYFDEKYKDMFVDMVYRIAYIVKNRIENGYPFEISMFTGLGLAAFSFDVFSKKTGMLCNFSKDINIFLAIYTEKKVESYRIENGMRTEYYDLIYGVSGVISYLVELEYMKNNRKIWDIIKFLESLFEEKEFNGYMLPKYHIEKNNLHNDIFKDYFKEGSINLGLSHGIISILYALSKSVEKGYITKTIIHNCSKIIDIYLNVFNAKQLYFGSQISPYEYKNQIMAKKQPNYIESWCYGSGSIAIALLNSINRLGINNEKYINISHNILKRNVADMNIGEIILCHGYSGLLQEKLSLNIITDREKVDFINLITENKKFERFFETKKSYLSLLEGISGIIFSLESLLSGNKYIQNLLMLS